MSLPNDIIRYILEDFVGLNISSNNLELKNLKSCSICKQLFYTSNNSWTCSKKCETMMLLLL